MNILKNQEGWFYIEREKTTEELLEWKKELEKRIDKDKRIIREIDENIVRISNREVVKT